MPRTIENLSLMPGSIGAVDLFMTLRNSLLRYDSHLLSSIFRSILRPIAAHGFAASIVLCIGGTAAGAFTSTPDLDYILVQQDEFDPAKPTSTQSLRGAKATRVDKLPQVLYEIGKNSHDADGGNPLAGEAAEKSRIVKRDVSTAVIEAKTRGYVGVNEAHGLTACLMLWYNRAVLC